MIAEKPLLIEGRADQSIVNASLFLGGKLNLSFDGKSPGQPSKLNDVQRQAIVRMIESGPIPAIHGVVRWRLIDLSQWIYEEFRITVAKQTLSRGLRAMGYRKLSARIVPSLQG